MIGDCREGVGIAPLVALVAMLVAFVGLQSETSAAPASAREPLSPFTIRWVPDSTQATRVCVEVSGLDKAVLRELAAADRTPEQWRTILAVYAEQGDLFADIGMPAMLGAYRVAKDQLQFEPLFALDHGVQYRAMFNPGSLPGGKGLRDKPLSSVFRFPKIRRDPSTVVSQVYPSGDVLPENLLKFYVHFSAPMRGGHIYEHIHLRNEAGDDVELPFLEIDEELWDPTMARLTLFIDPGRIKREVKPLEDIGPALEAGKRFTLVIGKEWLDAAGLPMKEMFRKSFRVGPPDRESPEPHRWKIQSPKSGSTSPLVISFPEAMDHALAQRMIRVVGSHGQLLDGRAALENHERRWKFTPGLPWNAGPHTVLIQTTIEDLAGNNIGKAFEVDLFEGIDRRLTNSTVRLAFEIK